jgi:hypothetical protein
MKAKTAKRDEQPTNLLFWFKDGMVMRYDARVAATTKVSIGRTDSKRALGFVVTRGKARLDFTA